MQNIRIEDLLEREGIVIQNDVISGQLQGKRVLVTGAAGSIGSEIVRQVSRFHPQMIILNDQSESPLHDMQLEKSAKFYCFKDLGFLLMGKIHTLRIASALKVKYRVSTINFEHY